jgi:hypothetical protein
VGAKDGDCGGRGAGLVEIARAGVQVGDGSDGGAKVIAEAGLPVLRGELEQSTAELSDVQAVP